MKEIEANYFKPVRDTDFCELNMDDLELRVWILIFNSEISPFEKSLLSLPFDELIKSIKKTSPKEKSIKPAVLCYCLLRANPNINKSDFFDTLKPFYEVNSPNLLLAITIHNRLDLMKTFLSGEFKYQVEQLEIKFCFHLACVYNCIEVFDFLFDRNEINRKEILDKKSGVLDYHFEAAERGHLYILKRIFQAADPSELEILITYFEYQVFTEALKCENELCFDYILNRTFELKNATSHLIYIFKKLSFILSLENIKTPAALWLEIKKDNYEILHKLILMKRAGAIKILIYLFNKKLPYMIEANNYELLNFLLLSGSLKPTEFVFNKTSLKNLTKILMKNEFKAFHSASKSGNLNILKQLINIAPHLSRLMIMANDFLPAREAALLGHEHILDYFFEIAPDLAEDILSANNYSLIRTCFNKGHTNSLNELVQTQPGLKKIILKQITTFPSKKSSIHFLHSLDEQLSHKLFFRNVNHSLYESLVSGGTESLIEVFSIFGTEVINLAYYEENKINVFNAAVCFKKTDAVDCILKISDKKLLWNMVFANRTFEGFSACASFRNLEGMKHLASLFPENLDSMVRANDYYAFRCAARYGNTEILQYLFDSLPNEINNMLSANNFEAFSNASFSYGDKEIKFLINHFKGDFDDLIARDEYKFIHEGCSKNVKKLKLVINLWSGSIDDLVSSNDYLLFKNAVEHLNKGVIEYLFEIAPDLVKPMIRSDEFYGFRVSAESHSKDLLEFLANNAQDDLCQMIKARNYEAFRNSIGLSGHYESAKYIFDLADKKARQEMVVTNYFEALSKALIESREKIIMWLLKLYPRRKKEMLIEASRVYFSKKRVSYDFLFNSKLFLLSHEFVLENCLSFPDDVKKHTIYPYLKHQLLTLLERKKSLELSNPKKKFTLTKKEVKKFKFMIDCIKSSGDKKLISKVKEVFSLPALKRGGR